jgi:YYY domain-containing protein
MSYTTDELTRVDAPIEAGAPARAGWRDAWARTREWLASDAAPRWILVVILIVAAYLRLSHLNWDDGTHIHPDERFLTMVESALELPTSLGQFFDSTQSPMSPYNKGYTFFVYGTLPIFIVRVVAEFVNKLNTDLHLWEVAQGIPINLVGYDGVHLVGRALSGIFDLGCVWLIYIVGQRLYSKRVGLLAALFYAFAALPLQQSHFFTVDTFGTFFALLTFYFAIRVAQGGGWFTYLALGASLGASIASRINLAPLAGIALLATGIRLWDEVREHDAAVASGGAARTGYAWLSTIIQAALFRLILMGLMAIAVFRVAQPYAFGGTSLLDFSFADQWKSNMDQIQLLISGDADYPPGHQWASRTPFVFPFRNMVIWGMGLPLGVMGWLGWLVAAIQIAVAFTRARPGLSPTMARLVKAHLLPVAWIGGMFLWQGLQYVQSMRYLLPIYPLLALMAAWLLFAIVDNRLKIADRLRIAGLRLVAGSRLQVAGSPVAQGEDVMQPGVNNLQPSTRARNLQSSIFNLRSFAYALIALVAIATILWGWGFLAIYRRPLTRVTATKWIYDNIPEGAVVANEHWDDPLPFSMDGNLSFKPGGMYYGLTDPSTGRREGQITNYDEDTPEKREKLIGWLNEADVLVLSSNRLWGSIPRLPLRYPMTTEYYKLLFEGKLGFELAGRFTSFPTIFGVHFDDTTAEEAFSVYDHPEVRIYRKTPAYSEELVRSYFDKIDLENTIQYWPKQVSEAPTALYMTAAEAARQAAGGTWSAIFDMDSIVNRSPVVSALVWLVLIELLGLAAFPLAFVVLRMLGDRGYGVSKVLGLLLFGWLAWIGPALKVVPYARWWILLCLALLIGVSVAVAWPRRAALRDFVRTRAALLLTEEGIFLVLFLLFLLIRVGNPDLWHPARGGEKPMEFAYLNAVIKSTTFPPYDPWHAGGYMNYYYFGWVMIGTLIKLTGIVPWVAYNLAVPTLFAFTGLGAFAVAYNLADGDPGTELPGEDAAYHGLQIGSLAAGLAGVFFVAIIGNLGNAKLVLDQLALRTPGGAPGEGIIPRMGAIVGGLFAVLRGHANLDFPNDWWFWNASRVIPDTINEFPFFTFVYADLHAHMLALPLTLLALAVVVAIVRLVERPPVVAAEAEGDAPTVIEPSPWYIGLAELLPVLLMGLVLGALRATNTWDFPTYTLAVAAALLILEVVRRARLLSAGLTPDGLTGWLAFLFRAAVALIWRLIILVAVSSLAFYPFTKYYATAYAGVELWNEARTQIPDYLVVWGFFLALALVQLIAELVSQARNRGLPGWLRDVLPFIIAAVVVVLGFAWGILQVKIWLISLPLFVLAVLLSMGRDVPPVRRLALLLLALALAITMGVEVIRQKDDIGRMNTVFKFYLQAWVLFGVATAYGLATWIPRMLQWRPAVRRTVTIALLVLFVGVMLYPPFAARAKVRDRFSTQASPHGLDGMAYMDNAQYTDNGRDLRLADDKAAMEWMMANVQGSPVILEAQIPEYRWGSRFSIYTGLPTVQGWNWHQRQQRSVVPSIDVERRVSQVQELYTTTDLARARQLLDHYNVEYIIVGELERAYYPPEGLAKFDELVAQGYLEGVYRGGTVTIYRVVGPRDTQTGQLAPQDAGIQPAPALTVLPITPEESEFDSRTKSGPQ